MRCPALGDRLADADDDTVLRLAAAVEDGSEHPVARAVVDAARARGLEVPGAEQFTATPGAGVQAVVDGDVVLVGTVRWLVDAWSITVPRSVSDAVDAAEAEGGTAVVVARNGSALGAVVVGDTVKPEAADAIRRLVALGLHPVLLTGDNEGAARAVATRSASTRSTPGRPRRRSSTRSAGCRTRAGAWRWSATA